MRELALQSHRHAIFDGRKLVMQRDLDAAVEDYIPPVRADPDMVRYMELLSVAGTTSRQLLTEEKWEKEHPPGDFSNLPKITTQLPLYNEFNVAERAIRAIAAFDYPTHLHQIQVLDDSDDETCALVDSVAEELLEKGIWIDAFSQIFFTI